MSSVGLVLGILADCPTLEAVARPVSWSVHLQTKPDSSDIGYLETPTASSDGAEAAVSVLDWSSLRTWTGASKTQRKAAPALRVPLR
jgi:hypothetical protein